MDLSHLIQNELEEEDYQDAHADEDSPHTEYTLTPPQAEFYLNKAKYPLFVGGFGSGKSMTESFCAVRDLTEYPGANIGMYAPTYDLLSLITIPFMEERLSEMGLPYKLNKSSAIFQVEGLGRIICRSMNNPGRIIGYQVFRSHVDELDTMKAVDAENAWNKIIARNRQVIFQHGPKGKRVPNPEHDPSVRESRPWLTHMNRVSAYTTPEGFCFAYKRWVEKKNKHYEMVKAPTRTNIHLPEDYIESLFDSYPPQLVEAYLNGDFVNMTSGAVYPDFDRVENHSDEVAQGAEPLEIGMDFNVMVGAACIHVRRDGLPVQVDEITKAYDTDDQIRTIKAKYPNNPVVVYPDASGSSRHSANTTETDLAKLRMAGFVVIAEHSNPAIKDRVFSTGAMICNGNQERRWKINTTKCPQTVQCLEQQVWNDNGTPDKTQGLDHHPDALGYYLHNQFPIVKPTASYSTARGTY